MVIDTAHITDMIDTADIAVMMMIVDVMSIATGHMITGIATGHMITGIVGIIGIIGIIGVTITKMSTNAALSSAKTHCGAFSRRISGAGEALMRTKSPLFCRLWSIANNAGALSAGAAPQTGPAPSPRCAHGTVRGCAVGD